MVTGAGYENFPTTINAFDSTFNGSRDVIVAIVNPLGSDLIYSSFLGGGGQDYGIGIATDLSGNIYLTGITDSINFPSQAGIQSSYGGGVYDAFVAKISINPLIAKAGPDQIKIEGNTVTLNGSDSTNLVGNIASYQWTQISGSPVTLSDPNADITTFVAPPVDPHGDTLIFELTIKDSSGLQDSDEVSIIINDSSIDIGKGGDSSGGCFITNMLRYF